MPYQQRMLECDHPSSKRLKSYKSKPKRNLTETTIFTSACREAVVEVELGVTVAVCFPGAFSDDILVAVMVLDLVSICRKSVEFQEFLIFCKEVRLFSSISEEI